MRTLAHNPTKARSRFRERGWSQVELLVGIVMVLPILGGSVLLCVQQARARALHNEISRAYVACYNGLEDLRALRFSDLPSQNGVGFDVMTPEGSPGGLDPVPGDADGLPGQFTVTVDKDSNGEILCRVKAKATWYRHPGNQELELERLMADRK